jgi:predicted cobalt transporter CbtA
VKSEDDMMVLTLGALIKSALIAGLIAGVITSGFHAWLIEPVIDRAIAMEEQPSHGHGDAASAPVVDRPTQRWGLVLGFVLYGAIWGVLLGLLGYLAQSWRPATWSMLRYGLVLALLLGWSVALFPFLKYPANPPGVGEPESVGYRQGLYVGFIGLSVLGTAVAMGLFQLRQRFSRVSSQAQRRWLLPAAFYVIYAIALYALFPANPDPIEMPAQLVWTFRLISFAGLMVFWLSLGGIFGWFAHDRAPAAVPG